MAEQIIGRAALEIVPQLAKDFATRLLSGARPAGRATGAALTDEVGKAGAESGRRYTSGLSDTLRRGPFRGIGGSIASGIVGGFAAIGVAQMGAQIGRFAIGAASNLEQLRIGFTTMLGGAKQANDFLHQLQSFANATPFEFQDVAQYAQQLLAMGFSAKQVIPSLTGIGDAVAALGGSSADVGRVVYALGQMNQEAHINAGDIRQLTDVGVPALRILADSYGVTTSQIQDMISKGKLVGTDVIPRLISGFEKGTKSVKGFGGMMEAQSHTFSGLMSTLHDSAQTALANGLQPLLHVFEKLLPPAISFVGSAMRTLSADLATTVTAASNFASAISRGFSNPAAAVNLPGWQGAVEKIAQTIGAGANQFTTAGREAFQGFQNAWRDPSQAVDFGLTGIAERIGGGLSTALGALDRSGVGQAVSKIFTDVKASNVGANLAKDVIGGIKTGIDTGNWSDLGHSLGDAISRSLNAIGDLGKTVTDALVVVLRSVDWNSLGKNLGTYLAAAIGGAANLAVQLTAAIGRQIGKIDWVGLGLAMGKQVPSLLIGLALGILNFDLGGLLKGLSQHWLDVILGILALAFAPERLVGFVGRILERVPLAGSLLKWMLDAAVGVSKGVVRIVGRIASDFVEGLLGAFGREVPKVGGFVSGNISTALRYTVSAAKGWAEDFAGVVRSIPGRIGGFAGDMLKAGAFLIRGLFDGFMTNIRSIDNMTSNVTSRLLGWARGAIGYLFGAGADLLRGLSNGAATAWLLVAAITGGISLRLFGWARSALTYLAGAGRDLIQGLFNGAGDVIKGVGAWVADIGGKIITAVKNFFGIHSPSTVFHELGGHMMQGLFNGVIASGSGLSGLMRTVFADAIKDPLGWAAGHAEDLIGLLKKVPGLALAIAERSPKALLGLLGKGLDLGGDVLGHLGAALGGGGMGVIRWAPLVEEVLGMFGLNTHENVLRWLRQINSESGGDPNIVQGVHDVNSGGNEAVGLVQVTPGTFDAYAGPFAALGRNNPLANLYAGIAWDLHKRQSPFADIGFGHGYARGGTPPVGAPFWVGESGPELMRLGTTSRVWDNSESMRIAGGDGGSAPLMHVENMHNHGTVDLDLALQRSEFRQRAGSFS